MDALATIKKPNSRLKRTSTKSRRIIITDRDIEIIKAIYKYRILRSQQIFSLFNEYNEDYISQRLGSLFWNGYLDRIYDPISTYDWPGARPIIYGLGNKGAEIISQDLGISRGKIDWSGKNRSLRPIFIEHKLLIAEVMISFEKSCKASDVRLIEPGEILSGIGETTQNLNDPFKLQVQISDDKGPLTLTTIPDHIFGLHFLDRPEGKNKAYFFLEADRGTMPVKRKNLQERKSSFYKKMVGYFHSHKQGLHKAKFNFENFRVLTVTSSIERGKNMIAANKSLNGGHGSRIFLFTDQKSITSTDNILNLPWLNGRDPESITLN